ncbi:ATP-dependent Clp protease proteolytic subunit [Paracoccus amoyensis]|uniref:ATP-dependent Clp protease proteolytic subunit n=1 Tax=Paracoccus amoyensis TaxID=2760093 RepID=UPI0031B56497
MLLSQILLAGFIIAADLWQSSGKAAPGLFAPPAEGPSIRPYRPDLRPAEPGTPAMRPMPKALEFSLTDGTIDISGQIAEGDADRFLQWLDQTQPTASQVSLDSSGGSVSDALAIGRTIRSSGYDTVVKAGAVCMSACPYLLAGGVQRQAVEGAVVGVHQHYFGQNTILPAFMAIRDLQRAQAGVMDYLTEMGVDLRLMSLGLRTPPEEINVLTSGQMQDLGLTTSSPS